ncbi:glycosyltransferase family 4 protein [Oceaniglobus roseus]|uniref:glycosyltransferase family 4 protein n=1 Tax=Oceaniglobus roseus TaxID=1737570 RepID=UPI000C7E8E75|nr:MraY family glycosyltransferase [Kandeliimicrobium roseum]
MAPLELLLVFSVTLIAIQAIRPLAPWLGLMDRPGAIKLHGAAVPSCGGLAIVLALGLALVLGLVAAPPAACLWVGTVAMLGALDDRLGLMARNRLAVQVAAATMLLAFTPYGFPSFGEVPPDLLPALRLIGLAICLAFAVGLVNGVNMIDGVDGLAGSVALGSLVWLIAIADLVGRADVANDAALAMAATAGFLVFNLRSPFRARASVFLGDAGSTALGATLACLILALAASPHPGGLPALLWLVALPVIDMASLIVRRTLARRSPFSGDRWHLHHLLQDMGLSPAKTTAAIAAASAACGGIGYLGVRVEVPAVVMLFGLAVPLALHTAFVLAVRPDDRARIAERMARLTGRAAPREVAAVGGEPAVAAQGERG